VSKKENKRELMYLNFVAIAGVIKTSMGYRQNRHKIKVLCSTRMGIANLIQQGGIFSTEFRTP
jgi:hypothetical protein